MVAFHDEFHPVFIQNFDEFPVVVTGINPDNDLSEINFQRFHLFQAAPEKFHRSILAVLKQSLLFGVEKQRQSVVIGPAESFIGTAMTAHEFGGIYRKRRYPKRPLMRPTLEKTLPKLPALWENSVKK